MNNTEKASEIAGLCHHCLDKDGNPFSICTKCKVKGIYYACIEMADWKDQQFIKFLEDRMGDEISVKMIEELKEIFK